MFEALLTYDPTSVSAAHREQMARILRARSEFLRASADIAELRARAWSGDQTVNALIELKAADLTKLREDYVHGHAVPFLKEAVDLDKLESLVPMVMIGVLQSLKAPLPIMLEALGLDFDYFKLAAEQLKEFISGEE